MSAEREKQLVARLWREGAWSKTGKINDVEGRMKKNKKKDFIISFRLWGKCQDILSGLN